MKASRNLVVVGLFGVLCAVGCGGSGQETAAAAQTSAAPSWKVRVNETRGPVRAADVSSALGQEVMSEILAGPTNGSDNAYLIFTRMPAGAKGPALFSLPDNHHIMVLEGNLSVQIGTDTFSAEPRTGVVIPSGTPHHLFNAGTAEVRVLEVIAPGSSRDLMSMLTPAQPRKIDNAASFIRRGKIPAQGEMKPGLNGFTFAGREQGTPEQMRIDSTLPGQGGPPPHVHKFQQVYFSIEGETTLLHGLLTYPLPKYSIAIVAPGAVHTNNNKTSAVERHVTLLLQEPPDRKEPFDIEVEFKGGVGATR